jgi:hypothetical protein
MPRRQPAAAASLLVVLAACSLGAHGQPEMSLFPGTNTTLLGPLTTAPPNVTAGNASAAVLPIPQPGANVMIARQPQPEGVLGALFGPALAGLATAGNANATNASIVPDLLPRRLPAEARAQWTQVSVYVWRP